MTEAVRNSSGPVPEDPLLRLAWEQRGVRFLLTPTVEVELTLIGTYYDTRPYKQGMTLQLVQEGQLRPIKFSLPMPWTTEGRETFLARAKASIPAFATNKFHLQAAR